jgi:hypothetical protein
MYNTPMISWLKKHFIPHTGNDHRPHILRPKNLRNIIFIVLFLEIFTFLIPTLSKINNTGGMASVLPSILANLTNEERQSQKLDVLTVNPTLNNAALMKATDMATKGYFAHTSPEGKTPWYWLEKAGYSYQYAGENLAINFSDSKDVTNAWMNSPTHRANIVKDKYTEVGTGVATGMYEGKETIFVAQVYANPYIAPTPSKLIKDTNKQIKDLVTTTKPTIEKGIAQINTVINNIDTKDNANILGAEVNTNTTDINLIKAENPTFIQKAFASPRNNTNTILFIVFGIITIALILNIVIKIKHHNPDLITNGLITLAIIGAIFAANYYISHRSMVITSNIDYSNLIK